MGVNISVNGDVLTASLDGDIDHHTAKLMRETIDESTSRIRPKFMEIDFDRVQFMDSSGIGLIMGRYKLMNSIGGKLKVINIPRRLEKMVKLSGLTALGIF